MGACAFCDPKNIEKHKVMETEREIVIACLQPAVPGHVMVIPKKHADTIHDLSDEDVSSLFRTIRQVGKIMKAGFGCDGVNYAWNEGEVSGQAVSHLHVHVLPRKDGDSGVDPRTYFYKPGRRRKWFSHEELIEYRDLVKEKIQNINI